MVFNQLDIHFTDYGHLCDIIRLDIYDRGSGASVSMIKLKSVASFGFVLGLLCGRYWNGL